MFDALKTTNEIIDFIRDYYSKNNIKGAVIGISGGKDSAVVAGLFSKAIGSENVLGVWMPCHSNLIDYNNALLVSSTFGFDLIEVDLTEFYDNYVSSYKSIYSNLNENELVDANINIKPRLRMATLYYNAALLSRRRNGVYIVPGTSNKCELFVGYFTKGGDNVCDIQVLTDLTVDEVIEVGKCIGVPDRVVNKAPDDGLSGKTDEEKLGVKYRDIACLMNDLYVPSNERVKILDLHNKNMHKFNIPTYKKK